MSEEYDKLVETFREETYELLSELETSLLELEKDPDNREAVSSIFRAFHSIKGAGGMFGFDEVSRFTHEIETVYDLVRGEKILPDKSLVDLSFAACDLIREMVTSPKEEHTPREKADKVLASLGQLFPEIAEAKKKQWGILPKEGELILPAAKLMAYRIRFKPGPQIFSTGTNPLLLLKELYGLGHCSVIAHTDAIPDLDEIDPELCYTCWDVVLTTEWDFDAIRDIFIFVEDMCELNIEMIDDGAGSGDSSDYKRLGEILVEKRDVTSEDLQRVLGIRKRLGDVLIDESLVQPESVQAALTDQEHIRQIQENRLKREVISNIRVSSAKLDKLVNLVGELVTVQARLSRNALYADDPELVSITEEVQRLTAELRDNTMNIRMLPIGTTFSKFRRLVRDLSKDLSKEVEMVTEGGDTELDKTVIERLGDPLVHLIRNCIDHGIEPPEVRESLGKPRKGTVRLSATHSGANVLIEIQDDGSGLDADAIWARAVEKGLVAHGAELGDDEIFSMIFAPGFSTAENVTNISGRGVGLDVVKKAVDSLRGEISIRSEKAKGTAITLRLPLTLAIIEGLLIRIGEEHFVLPLSAVEECVELIGGDFHGRHIANVRGQIVPYIRLREQFGIDGSVLDIEQIVIVKNETAKVGFVVDTVIGENQTVIKTLGRVYKEVEGISGATILGDGTVALILDVPELIKIAEEEELSAQRV
jgi:two-component system, chemotaxis family, sensor kinase CheA